MIKKYEIVDFEIVKEQIKVPITKFGGQPVWVSGTEWPVSMGWKDRKMMFVGQILLKKNMLGNEKDLVVYIFITHPENPEDNFFDPDVTEWDGGENAVIIQTIENEQFFCGELVEGPTLYNTNNEKFEYLPIIREGEDPDFLTNEDYRELCYEQQEEYFKLIDTNKIGGTPNFFREDAWPEGEWILLMQLKCSFLPFSLRLGSIPVMYVFISKDFKRGGMVIQN